MAKYTAIALASYLISLGEELIEIPSLLRTSHPTMKFPYALMREDNLKVLHVNQHEEFISHLKNVAFYKDNQKGTIRIQNDSFFIRNSSHRYFP